MRRERERYTPNKSHTEPANRHTHTIRLHIYTARYSGAYVPYTRSRPFHLKTHLSIIITITSISPRFQNFFFLMIRYLFDCLTLNGAFAECVRSRSLCVRECGSLHPLVRSGHVCVRRVCVCVRFHVCIGRRPNCMCVLMRLHSTPSALIRPLAAHIFL